jgi:hypothetical protein
VFETLYLRVRLRSSRRIVCSPCRLWLLLGEYAKCCSSRFVYDLEVQILLGAFQGSQPAVVPVAASEEVELAAIANPVL